MGHMMDDHGIVGWTPQTGNLRGSARMIIHGRNPSSVGSRFHDKPLFVKTARVRAFKLPNAVDVETLEGTMHANEGDYLVADEDMTHCWPVRSDIFESTYEEVETDG